MRADAGVIISASHNPYTDNGIKIFSNDGFKLPDELEAEIEKAARDCQATMIVLGSSAKTAWVEKWLGSTPRSLAEKSVYPTLLIPPEKG